MLIAVSIPVALLGLVVAAAGTAGITRGWVPARERLSIQRPRLYGWGLMAAAFGLCSMAADGVVFTDSGIVTVAALVFGAQVLRASRRPAGDDDLAGGKS
ncbi:hypothetical protein ACFV5G_37880 [Streptomyces sp. NPDC059766]|uniref:hypothetical protein n=1 Tax=Streptomyces sp. NPDC059766 TaxID=3346940 RepID=UPI003666DC6B